MAQDQMDSFEATEQLDILEDTELCFVEFRVVIVMSPLVFERREEPFHRCAPGRVVVTPRSAHPADEVWSQ